MLLAATRAGSAEPDPLAPLEAQLRALSAPAVPTATRPRPWQIVSRTPLYAPAPFAMPPSSFPSMRRIAAEPAPRMRALAATVRVITARWHGSGVIVSPDGAVLTSCHLVAGVPSANVQTLDGRIFPQTRLLAFSLRHDLALLKIEAGPLPFLRPAAGDAPAAGAPLTVLGHSGDALWSAVGAASLGEYSEYGSRLLHFNADILPGASGGPVVDADGRLVALTAFAARRADGATVMAGVSAAALQEFLDRPVAPLLL